MAETNMKFMIALARGYNAVVAQVEKNVQVYGLNMSEFGVLEMLLHKGEQPVQKIAEKILVTSGTITYTIDKLESKHLVSRVRCEKDKRVIYLSLTEKGTSFITYVFSKHNEFIDELLGDLSEDFKKDITKQLFQVQDAVDATLK